jgi:integrase
MMRGMGGVFQRNGKWYYRTRLRGGRLYRESLAKYGITTEAQAHAYMREMEKAKLEGRLAELDPSTKTLSQFIEEYLAHRAPLKLSPATKRQDAIALRSLQNVLGANSLLRSIRQRKVDGWVSILLGQGCSPFSINSYLGHIRAALNLAVEWGYLKEAPRIRRVKPPSRLPRALTPEEIDQVLAKEASPERRALWEFFLWTGARRQEVIDLHWKDVHLENDAPWVRPVGKGDKERLVPLMPGAVSALRMMPTAEVGPVWVFGGKPVTSHTLSHWFKRTARLAGVPDAHLHDLRHTAATWMAARGVNERIIQEVMGHARSPRPKFTPAAWRGLLTFIVS